MPPKSDDPKLSRRALLLAGPAVAAGTAAAAGTEVPADGAEVKDPTKTEFRETEHVKTFYRLARS
ncbi:formate dehydrogenase region TAT target [Poseidonocella pacifica]|uniref:Formate dehydrogenase region TAT target n=1 Tax=Poseidonocella pacifica TaxID=871651 RepID=A0A1I0YCF2_9RHOB|nr:hypothetical protein [Poseidonocella pacifica]SFB11049.1 formate dehydrogenase region TAT target [Poseidonocella pacifica]